MTNHNDYFMDAQIETVSGTKDECESISNIEIVKFSYGQFKAKMYLWQ